MAAYYNENDPFCVAWLRELIKAGLIAGGFTRWPLDRAVRDTRADATHSRQLFREVRSSD